VEPDIRPHSISCFVRADFGPYPRRMRQGTLRIEGVEAAWSPFWSFWRRQRPIDRDVTAIAVRDAGPTEPNAKHGGRGNGRDVPQFRVVVCTTPRGTIELVVPPAEVDRLTAFFAPRPG